MPFFQDLPVGKRNQTQLSRTRFGNCSEYMLRLIDLKLYFTMVNKKDMDLSQGYKMTSPTAGDVQSGASLVYAGSLPGNICRYWHMCHGSLVLG